MVSTKLAIARIIRTILWFKYRDQVQRLKLLREIELKQKLLAKKRILVWHLGQTYFLR